VTSTFKVGSRPFPNRPEENDPGLRREAWELDSRTTMGWDLVLGNQLVSYTRQMDLVRIGEQAKFENASLRTKHFRT